MLTLGFTGSPAIAQRAGSTENDNACAMISSFAKIGADHARLARLLQLCARSSHCLAARQTMVTAGRSDVDTLNCEQAPPPDPRDADADRAAEEIPHVGESDRACAVLSMYAKMGVGPDAVKALVPLCNKNPDPKAICDTVFVFKMANRPNPGLVCANPR
jgi:hypothetical protein